MCFLTKFIFRIIGAQNVYSSSLTAPKWYFKLVGLQDVYFSSFTAPKWYFKLVGVQHAHFSSFSISRIENIALSFVFLSPELKKLSFHWFFYLPD